MDTSSHHFEQVGDTKRTESNPVRRRATCIRWVVVVPLGTEASRKPVPLDLRLSKVLWNWRLLSPYPIDEDRAFASPPSKVELPYWPGSLYKAHLEPAAKEVGIVGHFGWHTFRNYSEFRTITE